MLSLVRKLWPSPWLWRKLFAGAVMAVLVVAAFFWGRHGGMAQTRPSKGDDVALPTSITPPVSHADYNRVVAYLYDSIPITRAELGEYLIARFGTERIEFLVNRKIVELACRSKGIAITDVEVEQQLQEDLKAFGNITVKEFASQVLKRFNKSLYEWKEDVIRPKLALAKYCRGLPQVEVTDADIHKAFEARFGPKVQCRMIVVQNKELASKIRQEVVQSEEAFAKHARTQYIPDLAAKGGAAPPIHKHFGDLNIEREAFSLKVGEVSKFIEMPDKTCVILKCDAHLPADTTRRLEDERFSLHNQLVEFKLAQEIPKVFQTLRAQANPKVLLGGPISQVQMEQEVRKELKLEGPPKTN